MKILLLKTWIVNIGNGFIDMGAKACIHSSFPNAEIIEVSGYPNYIADEKAIGGGLNYAFRKKLGITFKKNMLKMHKTRENMVNISELLKADIAVVPGCILYPHAINKYMKTLVKIRDKNIPILLLGVGGGNYSKETKNFVKTFFNTIKPAAMITRDNRAFKLYSSDIKNSYDGIDCGFFINEWYKPPKSDTNFSVCTFDKLKEPKLEININIIRPNHTPFDNPFRGCLRPRNKYRNFNKTENIFMSDDIKDYLFLYANALETHSDRVHACVASLTYKKKAKFYFKSPRAYLFDRVLDENIREKLVQINEEKLNLEKKKMISKFKGYVEAVL